MKISVSGGNFAANALLESSISMKYRCMASAMRRFWRMLCAVASSNTVGSMMRVSARLRVKSCGCIVRIMFFQMRSIG